MASPTRQQWLLGSATALAVSSAAIVTGIVQSTAELNQKRTRVAALVTLEKRFMEVPYRLDRASYEMAVRNRDAVNAGLEQLQHDLRERYVNSSYAGTDMSPLRFKGDIQNQIEVMDQTLLMSKVKPPAIGPAADFEQYFMQQNVFASPAQIEAVNRQLQVHDELVALACQSGVEAMDHLRFQGETKMPTPTVVRVGDENLYQYHDYELSVVGDTPALQAFLTNLDTSNMCFVVRYLELATVEGQTATAFALGLPQGIEAETPALPSTERMVAKADRVIPRDFASTRMTLRVQFVEFLN